MVSQIQTAMISPKGVNIYGYVFLGIILVMLALVWFRLVPQPMYLPLFLIALALYLVRITLRLVLARQQRMLEKDKAADAAPERDQEAK